MASSAIQRMDSDGDGGLSQSEVSDLSSDAFSELDSDGNGILSSEEMSTAFDSLEGVDQSSLSSTAAGQLLDATKPTDGPPPPPPGGASKSEMADSMTSSVLSQLDSDSDGSLSQSEISGLSDDAFSALDTDGDGLLNSDEIKTALQTQMDAVDQAFQSSASSSSSSSSSVDDLLSQLDSTPEGQLMSILQSSTQSSNGMWSASMDSGSFLGFSVTA